MGAAQSYTSLPPPAACLATLSTSGSAYITTLSTASIPEVTIPVTTIATSDALGVSLARRQAPATTTSSTTIPTTLITITPTASSASSTSTSSSSSLSSSTTSSFSSSTPSSSTSSSSTLPLPYSSVPLPSSTGAPNYIFVYGDSYTSTGFNIANTPPALHNPMGNPTYPGSTSTGTGQANWIDILASNSPLNTLVYDFAVGGASVDNNITDVYTDTPAFVNQSATWLSNLATKPKKSYCQWTAANSVHVIWFGRNDVFWQVNQNASMVDRLTAVQTSYVKILNNLWLAGARRFVVMGIPPMWLEPNWNGNAGPPWDAMAPQIQPSSVWWNQNLPKRLATWKKGKPAVKLTFVDTWPAYSRVLDNYAAWSLLSATCRNDDPTQYVGCTHIDGNCPFADTVHPGPTLAKSVGIAVGQHLLSQGYLKAFALS